MWEKIVLNLLSNAVKFTLEGEIAVSLRTSGENVELRVRDTGTGIPAAEMPRLFERFHRVRGAVARTQEGTGIGLALVQELARLHGGRVRAESTIGRGSTFIVALPRGSAHLPADRIGVSRALESTALGAIPYVEEALRWLPDAPSPRYGVPARSSQQRHPSPLRTSRLDSAPEGGEEATRTRILLADDNADMREYLRRLLSREWTVEAVADGASALAAAYTRPPDLVLTDIMMPGIDGLRLLQELRSDPRTRLIPVILLSARSGEEALVEGLSAGADDYLIKPFSARELLARVRTHVETARVRKETARLNEELQRASRVKDQFLATLAHELRNPLGAAGNAVQILRTTDPVRPAWHRALEILTRQIAHQARMVEDLLNVSRIARGKLTLQTEALDLVRLVEETCDDHRGAFDRVGISLDVSLPPQPIGLRGDRTRLAQILSNLLQNAVKFTPSGGHVTVRVASGSGHAVITVSDTGVGISAEILPHIWDAFAQADDSLERTQGGLGLGLALVRGLVRLHGGEAQVESTGKNRGAAFSVRLPLDPEAALQAGAFARARTPHAGRRILIVEDNRDAADTLQELLEIEGHLVAVTYAGSDAVEAARRFRPEVVLCDVGLPGMSGYEVARRLRQESGLENILLVAITGYGLPEDRRRSEEAGFAHHLVKPVEIERLARLLDGHTP
jgi:signal transduction histidine kinase